MLLLLLLLGLLLLLSLLSLLNLLNLLNLLSLLLLLNLLLLLSLLLLLLSDRHMALLVMRSLLMHPAVGVTLRVVLMMSVDMRRRHHVGQPMRIDECGSLL